MELLLIRSYYPNGTNGTLYYNKQLKCYTIELPWLDNKPRCSCIPEGRYRLRLRYSQKFKQHMQLEGVKDRELILVHPANNALKELKGCIAPVTKLTGEGTGVLSRNAFEKLSQLVTSQVNAEPVFITIKSIKK